MKKLSPFYSLLTLVFAGLLAPTFGQAPFTLPPRGYILPPAGGNGAPPRPQYAPAPTRPYPGPGAQSRPASAPRATAPKARPAPIVSPKPKPAPVVAKAKPKKAPVVSTKKQPAKPAVASTKKKPSPPSVATNKVPSSKVLEPKPASKGNALASDLHRPAANLDVSSKSPASVDRAPNLKSDEPEIVVKIAPKKVVLDGPWGVPDSTKWLTSLVAKQSEPKAPLPSVLDQPPSLAATEVLAPPALTDASLPIEEISPPEPEVLRPTPAVRPTAPVEERAPIAATPPPPAKVFVQPTLAAVRPAAYQLNEPDPEPSSDFTPGGPTFDEPPPPAPAKPIANLSPSLGNLAIDADRVDNDNVRNIASFHGNVNLSCDRFQMKADKVVANMGTSESGAMDKVVGEGNVTVRMLGTDAPAFVGSGSRAIFDPATETIILQGWPKVEEGMKALVASSAATEIRIDTKTNRLTTTGSTKTLIRK